jgi:hypothetical protein
MKQKIEAFFIVLAGLCGLIACHSNSTPSAHDTTIIDYKLTQGKPLPPGEWHCYNVDEEKICIPSSWGYVKQDKFLFVSDISRMSPGSYFVVVKHNMKKSGFTPIKYLSQIYSDLKTDTTGRLIGHETSKINYSDKETFSSEFHTLTNNVPYITYSTIFECGNDLFEIALKIEKSKAKSFQEDYKDILFNFYYNNKLVFSINDKLTGVETIDLDKLH